MGHAITKWLRAVALAATMAGASHAVAEQQLNFSWPQNVGPLDPHHYALNQMFAQAMVYESLVAYAADGSIAPWLATGWDISGDGRVWLFYLRDDVRFTDGARFDAAAVAANFSRVMEDAAQHSWLELVNQLVSVVAVDELTVRFTLKDPYYPLLQELALARPVRFLSPAQLSVADGMRQPVGTGPWVLVESALGEYDFILALHQRVKIPELHSPAALVRFTLNLSRLRW